MRNQLRSIGWALCSALCVACGSGGSADAPPSLDIVVHTAPTAPTRGAWGPDGRFYVTARAGTITAFTFDDAYDVVDEVTYPGVSGTSNAGILGVAFSPLDDASVVRMYVAHSPLSAISSDCSETTFPFAGQISRVDGPDFDTPIPIVENLPCSGRSHGVNGLAFADDGVLYALVGGTTNAGLPSCGQSNLLESPLSGAVLRLDINDPSFDGVLTYTHRISGTALTNQVLGHDASWTPSTGVTLMATGVRNPFDLHWMRSGALIATDNGADQGGGDASLSATTQARPAHDTDRLIRIEAGAYYGHPNRNRGRTSARENVYQLTEGADGSPLPNLVALPSSTNGLDEIRSQALGASYVGAMVVQQFNGATYVARGTTRSATLELLTTELPGLDIVEGPGGALLVVDFIRSRIRVGMPIAISTDATLLDVFPARGPLAGGTRFVLSGRQLDGVTSVRFGATSAAITSQSSARIVGTVPAGVAAGDVNVTAEHPGGALVLSGVYRYLAAP